MKVSTQVSGRAAVRTAARLRAIANLKLWCSPGSVRTFISCHRPRAFHHHLAFRRRACRLPCWTSRACCWNEHCLHSSRANRRQIHRDYPSKNCCPRCDCRHDRRQHRECCPCCLGCRQRRDHQHLQGASCCRDFHPAGQRFAARIVGDCLVNHHASCRRTCLR